MPAILQVVTIERPELPDVDEGASVIRITHSDEAVGSIDKIATKKMPEQKFGWLNDQPRYATIYRLKKEGTIVNRMLT